MKFQSELTANKSIVSVEPYDVTECLEMFPTEVRRAAMLENIRKVEVYRFIYKVNKLQVVGYVSIPKIGNDLPCLIHLRGGSKDFSMLRPRTIAGQLVKFSAQGYVVISTQYPGVEGGDGEDAFGGIDDIASIVKLRNILKSLSVVDIKKIGVKGHSRGGLMTYMLLREVKWVKAAVIAGTSTDQVSAGKDREGWRDHQIRMWGKSRSELIRRSPLRWVDDLPKKTPMLLMHGSADWRVLASHSLKMSSALYEKKIPHRFILFEGADHGITEYREEYFAQTLNWFDRFLKQGESLPKMTLHGE